MNSKQITISSIFTKHLFWDANAINIDTEQDKQYIIEKVLMTTFVSDYQINFEKLLGLYSKVAFVT